MNIKIIVVVRTKKKKRRRILLCNYLAVYYIAFILIFIFWFFYHNFNEWCSFRVYLLMLIRPTTMGWPSDNENILKSPRGHELNPWWPLS